MMTARPLFTDSQWQRGLTIGILAIFFVVGVQYTFKVAGDSQNPRSAFLRWRNQVLAIDDANIYQQHGYPNPPIMALLLRPLAQLPPVAGALLWFIVKVGMVLLVFRWVFRLIEHPDFPFPLWTKTLAILLSIRPIMGDLTHGNVNILILFLIVAALNAFRNKLDGRAGIVLALAIACKITPALFVPYLVWKRAWKSLAGCAAGLAFFWLIVPGLLLGFGNNARLLGSWADHMVRPFVLEGAVITKHSNQSLPGTTHRLLTRSASFSEFQGDALAPLEYHNFAELSQFSANMVVKLCMAAFAVLVMWSCRTPTNDRGNPRLAIEYSMIVLGMLLFSERTWKHHCVTLIMPFAVLLYFTAAARMRPGTRRYLIGTLVAVCLLIMATSTGFLGDAADRFGKLAQVYGAHTWAFLLLMAALVVLLRSKIPFAPAIPTANRMEVFRVRRMPRCDHWIISNKETGSVSETGRLPEKQLPS